MMHFRGVHLLCVLLFSAFICGFVHNGAEVTTEYLENHPLLRAMAGRRHIPLESVWGDNVPSPIWFEQLLDHFNPMDNRTFNQRVVIDDQFWQPGGPIFIFLDGEAPMTFFPFQEVTPYYWAEKFGMNSNIQKEENNSNRTDKCSLSPI